MSDSYLVELSVTLPLSEAQYDGILQLLGGMDSGRDALLIRVTNHEVFDDFMAVYVEWRDYGYHVELDFPMDDFDWKYPLVLACGLDGKDTVQLLRDLLVDVAGTGENEVVYNRFRRVTAVRYGERKAQEYAKGESPDRGKEERDDCWHK